MRERQTWAHYGVECLIINERGYPLGENGQYSLFARVRRAVHMPCLHAHPLRHTWATNFRLFYCGDLLDLRERGGWANLSMVRRYAHIRPDSERSPLDMFRAANTQPKTANYRTESGVQNAWVSYSLSHGGAQHEFKTHKKAADSGRKVKS